MESRIERLQRLADEGTDLVVRGVYIGQRIETRQLEATRLGSTPLVVEAGRDGLCVVFRYGVLVFVHVSPAEQETFKAGLDELLKHRFEEPVVDSLVVRVRPDGSDRVEEGVVVCSRIDLERIQVIAHGIAKSIALIHYEDTVAAAFDEVEPVVAKLEAEGRTPRSPRRLAKRIGAALRARTRTVGRMEVTEKPEVLWEHPELDSLYTRMADELELVERQRALERKLAVTEQATRAVLDLRMHAQTLRVEWYIVLLILVEILIYLYELSH